MGYYSDFYSAQAMAVILQGLEDLIESLLNGVKIYTTLEMTMIGLERCEDVTKIQTERKPKIDETLLMKKNNWPSFGKIKFLKYFASYRPDTPNILKNINLEIKSGDKVGIVGRTGSGKSSMVLALSRILEPKLGQIFIDDIDIQNIDLDYLRQSISIVPQESFIIEGNLRDNIDPLNKYSDKKIIEILNDLCLFKDLDDNEKLKLEIKEGGKNLSNGQKQLICFARAIIKNNKIIILDEAISSLDLETEKIIKMNMEKYFKDVTLIMITHHIHMVKNCRKIIVVDQGRIIESGQYEALLKDKKSHFYSLYEESKAM
jgi:ABC-type multidrug transport system fused ATPase/permease subunit